MAGTAKTEQVTVDNLLEDLQTIVTDAEALLKATADQAGERAREARAKVEESLSATRERLVEVKTAAAQRARDLVSDGEEYVKRNPWQAVGIAAGAGLLVGLLLSLNRR